VKRKTSFNNLFTLVLDMALINARPVKSKLELGSNVNGNVVSFKRTLYEQLVVPLLHEKNKRNCSNNGISLGRSIRGLV
jgi:hypothetical protein